MIAGAAAAMRVKHWTPIDAFLEHRNTTPVIGTTMDADAKPGSAFALNHHGFGSYDPDASAPGGFATGTAGKLDAGRRNDMDFDNERLPGAASAGTAGASASLGQLWRLMGLVHGDNHTVTTSSHGATTTHPSSTKPSTPPRHSPGASAPHPSAPVVTAPVTTIAQITTPAMLIGNNATPVSGLIGGGTSHLPSGAFSTGGTRPPSIAGGVGGFSATPEPASALLVGTGLLALSMMLRRRRT